jgi:UDP:flavonoid glycosyltransferase YjiC (YdhE family)
MELALAGRPFLYFPLLHHFEQQFHVPHRLARIGAGRRMDYTEATPELVAAAVFELLERPVHPPTGPADGAARAADLLVPLLG